MEKYLDKLLKQFMEARGIRHANVNSEEFVNEFCSWIKENKLVSWKFITLLDYMNGQTYLGSNWLTMMDGMHPRVE